MNSKPCLLSVCIIASNAQEEIQRVLHSVGGWTDEIILLLNDSSDSTAELATTLGAKIHYAEWTGYRDQKNKALALCQGEWILSLDSDEVVTPELKKNILEFIKKSGSHNAARFSRKVWFMDRWILHGVWYPDYCTRLFKNGHASWTGEQVHEKIQVNGSIRTIKGDLEHYTYRTLNHQMFKMIEYSDIFAMAQLSSKSNGMIILRAIWAFIRHYFIKLGFLDGFPGFYIGVIVLQYTLMKYSKCRYRKL
jgi:glycosyltransferase involved in cell wall biosynthesis